MNRKGPLHMNTPRRRTPSWGVLRHILTVLATALTTVSLLPGPIASGGAAESAASPGPEGTLPLLDSDLPTDATATWWITVQRQAHHDILGLSPTPDWTATGERDGDSFGVSVASAGDVNGDGFVDVIVGAVNGGYNRGRAYVYYGSPGGLSTTPNWTATGENTQDFFGVSVASAGDVNGDGFADIIVGAEGYPNENWQGKAYVYHGSPTGPSSTPDWTAAGEDNGDLFGHFAATAGDVNGDGFADVAVGAPGIYFLAERPGKAYLYHGSPAGLSPTPVWTTSGENNPHYYGDPVTTAGDVNLDGYADLIVGAHGYGTGRGKAYVYLGSAMGLGLSPDWSATGENEGDFFGIAASTAGDINGDGHADVIIGANAYPSQDRYGRAYVYYGSPSGLGSTPEWTATGENSYDNFAYAVASAGDVNGDGFADVLVGAGTYPNWSSYGKAYAYHGSPAGPSLSPDWTATGEQGDDCFGRSLATAGDVSADGYADVIVGAWGHPFAQAQGKAYVYHGAADTCIPVSEASVSGPSPLPAGVSGLYSTTLTPPTVTWPISVTWSNGAVGFTAAYSWTVTGSHSIAVTATNDCGQAQDTFTVTVFCQAVEEVEVSGPLSLPVGQVGSFQAAPQPITASLPLTFTWDNGTIGPTAAYSWTATGTYTTAVTVTNPCSSAQGTLQVQVIEAWPNHLYLPLVLKQGGP